VLLLFVAGFHHGLRVSRSSDMRSVRQEKPGDVRLQSAFAGRFKGGLLFQPVGECLPSKASDGGGRGCVRFRWILFA
jgi:hypothetical protein